MAINVKRLREARGWTQERLAEESGMSSVAMIESGVRQSPRPETIRALAGALGVAVADLYTAPEDQRESSASLDEFLASPFADDVSPDELAMLKRTNWPWGTPTIKTWLHLLGAIRSTSSIGPANDQGENR